MCIHIGFEMSDSLLSDASMATVGLKTSTKLILFDAFGLLILLTLFAIDETGVGLSIFAMLFTLLPMNLLSNILLICADVVVVIALFVAVDGTLFIEYGVGLLFSVSDAWPLDKPSSSTGMLVYNREKSGITPPVPVLFNPVAVRQWLFMPMHPFKSFDRLSKSPQFES